VTAKTGIEYATLRHSGVPGWFNLLDALTFIAVDQEQRERGVVGDILEVGAYLGKSAILLGYLLREEERLVVIDLFGEPAPSSEGRAEQSRVYIGLSQAVFESNYARFHAVPPAVLQGASDYYLPTLISKSFRLIHVDGSHEHEAVRGDLAEATRLVQGNGLIVMDDIISPHTPGVAAAAWEAVANGGLVPLIQTAKLYATVPGSLVTADNLADRLPGLGIDIVQRHIVYGHPILQVRSPNIPDPLGRRILKNIVPPGVANMARRVQRLVHPYRDRYR
jgi:hypothetical protein